MSETLLDKLYHIVTSLKELTERSDYRDAVVIKATAELDKLREELLQAREHIYRSVNVL